MVPDREKPPSDARGFSPEVQLALESALLAYWTNDATGPALSTALKAASQDARERGLLAEELLIAYKAVEQRVAARVGKAQPTYEQRGAAIRDLINAYYLD